jgi:hypothetical protein
MVSRPLKASLILAIVLITSATASAYLSVPRTTGAQCTAAYNNNMADCYGWVCNEEQDYYGCVFFCGLWAGEIEYQCQQNVDPENNAAIACTIVGVHAYYSCSEDTEDNLESSEFIHDSTPDLGCESGWKDDIHKFDPTDDNSLECYYF